MEIQVQNTGNKVSGRCMGWVENGGRGMERKQCNFNRKPRLRVTLEMEHKIYLWAYWQPEQRGKEGDLELAELSQKWALLEIPFPILYFPVLTSKRFSHKWDQRNAQQIEVLCSALWGQKRMPSTDPLLNETGIQEGREDTCINLE